MNNNTLIVIDNEIDINFYIIALSFYNFLNCETQLDVMKPIEKSNITDVLKSIIPNIKEKCDIFSLVICNYDYYNSKKHENCKYIVYYDQRLLENFCLNDNDIFIRECDVKWHLNEVTIFNLDLNTYCKLINNKFYSYSFPKLKECFYVNNAYLKYVGLSCDVVGEHAENINLEKINDQYYFDYGICKYNDDFYTKIGNTISKTNVNDDFLVELAGTVKSIKYTEVNSIDNFNVKNATQCLHFTIAILSRNNEQYVKKNLDSALNQEYDNFDVLFIDCNSNDLTSEIARQYKNNNLTIIRQHERTYQTENFIITTLLAKKNSIIVSLDGDDWFPHNNVLKILNKVYLSQRCLLTYGSYMEFPFRNIRVWKEKSFEELVNIRKNKKSLSHLRTWNKDLFLNIKLEDLKMNGKFPEMAGDVSVLLYMAEMCPDKCVFVAEPMYVYNRTNCQSDSVTNEPLQIATAEYFFNKQSYTPKNYNKYIQYDNDQLFIINQINGGLFKIVLTEKYIGSKRKMDYIKSNRLYDICDTHESSYKMINVANLELWENFFKGNKLCTLKQKTDPRTEKLIIGIISCNKRLAKAQSKMEYFKKFEISQNFECKIFIGDGNFIYDEFEENGIVHLKVPDNYESLPKKVHAMLKWINSNTNFNYVFKTDDDIEIQFDKLFDVFKHKVNNKTNYAGNVAMFSPFVDSWHFGKCENPEIDKTKVNINVNGIYCSGGGYFVNIKHNPKIIDEYLKNHMMTGILSEDLLMGITMNNNDTLPLHINYFENGIIKNWDGETNENKIYHMFSRSLLSLKN